MTGEEIDRDIAETVAEAAAEARQLTDALAIEMESAAARLTIVHLTYLNAMGIAGPIIAHFTGQGRLGSVNVGFDHHLWVPEETGPTLMVTPLGEDGVIVDLIAFNPHEPANWAMRTGASWALGLDVLTDVNHAWTSSERHLTLHATPFDWIRDGGNGLCVVQWNDEARATLRKVPLLKVQDQRFAQLVRLELTRPPAIPEIAVNGRPTQQEVAADGNG